MYGDYVNGGQVREIKENFIRISGGEFVFQYLKNEDTKEMMKSIEYRVNRDMETN